MYSIACVYFYKLCCPNKQLYYTTVQKYLVMVKNGQYTCFYTFFDIKDQLIDEFCDFFHGTDFHSVNDDRLDMLAHFNMILIPPRACDAFFRQISTEFIKKQKSFQNKSPGSDLEVSLDRTQHELEDPLGQLLGCQNLDFSSIIKFYLFWHLRVPPKVPGSKNQYIVKS